MLTLLYKLWWVTRKQLRADRVNGVYVAGLFAFFLANIGSLMVSGQILADPFIAAFLGLTVGFVLAFGKPEFAAMQVPQPQPRPRPPARVDLGGVAGEGQT
jgi:hypothetical protein